MGLVIGFLATLSGALLGASFGSYCDIEYGGAVGFAIGLLAGLVSSEYAWRRYRAGRKRREVLRMELRAMGRKRAA
jgi:hypothetical protein